LLNPEDVDEAFGISLQSSVEVKIWHYFICTSIPVMAANFDVPLTSMLESVHTSPAVLACGCRLWNFVDILHRRLKAKILRLGIAIPGSQILGSRTFLSIRLGLGGPNPGI